jgi:TatA/E family protein of Tat protein translocase
MFGTLGFSELIIILVIVLIIFGAGKLPQIGEGVGKALKGFKKEVHDIPQPDATPPPPDQATAPALVRPAAEEAQVVPPVQAQATPAPKPTAPYTPGPELTPGTTAAMMTNLGPQAPKPRVAAAAQGASHAAAQSQQPLSMEERMAAPSPMARAQYPPLPPGAQPKPVAKRPSAVVNKEAVARVQAAQAAQKVKAQQQAGVSPQDMQSLGEGLGDVMRTFRQAVADVRNSVDPEMRTIQAEMDAAQKEIQQSIEAARESPAVQEDPPKPA